MQLLPVTALFLLVNSLCGSQGNPAAIHLSGIPSTSPTTPTAKATVPTPNTASSQNLTAQTPTRTSPNGSTSNELSKTSAVTTVTSLTTKSEGNTTRGVPKSDFATTKATVTNTSPSSAVSTSQSSPHKLENQSSIKTTEISANTQKPSVASSTSPVVPSPAVTTANNLSQLPGTDNGKNPKSSSRSPSYSSIILPVVIALIVITLSVFILVGLYRMCWKKDPGTQENGNDQPQSDKESVKLLTVKTISHESGEHSGQGRAKN